MDDCAPHGLRIASQVMLETTWPLGEHEGCGGEVFAVDAGRARCESCLTCWWFGVQVVVWRADEEVATAAG